MQEKTFLPVSRLQPLEAPVGLLGRVMNTVRSIQLRQLRIRFAIVLTGFIVSVTYIISSWSLLWEEFQTSSFFEFVRLAFSDPDIVFTNIKVFFTGLLEAMPSDALFVIATSLFFLLAIIILTRTWRQIRQSVHMPSVLTSH